jgi:RimJ/RimL family protein N-acetyltransferase
MKTALLNRIRLAPFTEDRVERTFAWISKPTLQRAFLMRGEPTRSGHESYFARVLADPAQRVYAILCDDEHVGNCGFKHIDPGAGEGELWIYVGPRLLRGKGVGEAATRLLLREGTERLGLRRVFAHVAEDNEPARRLYARAGFVQTGMGAAEWGGRGVIRMLWESRLA